MSMTTLLRRASLVLLLFLCCTGAAFSQQSVNFNQYYRFPISVGVSYQSLSPLGDYGTDYTSYFDLSGIVRLPLARLPVLQPLLQAGAIRFVAPERDGQERWTHTHWYALAGLGYANRFSKNFELGVELAAGMSEAIFPNLDPPNPRSSPNVLASAGVRLSLNPSYSTSVDVNPTLKYLYSLTPLTRFNGLVYGIGFSVHYRFGEDPDAPQAIIRSLKISDLKFPPLFAAMQSYYSKNPFGQVTLTNVEKQPIFDLVVSFSQAGYMDTPSRLASIDRLEPGQSRTVDITASFNEAIFTTAGVVPLTGEIIAEYVTRRRAVKQSFPLSYDLYDKTALTWDDNRKVGAFITPADSALRNYVSFLRQSSKEASLEGLSGPLQTAMQVFYGLKELGCLYQVDPTSPFTAAQENPQRVDSISLPRDTLKRLTGDCDDLTVLYCALLESVGEETAFITVPGHIYAAVNTQVPSKQYQLVHQDKNMTLPIDGTLWVPVEITMIGTDDFLDAWRRGIEQFAALDGAPDQRQITFTARAQELFRPVGLRETDLGLQYGSSRRIVDQFSGCLTRLVDQILEGQTRAAQELGSKEAYNRLGIICAQYRRLPEAQKAFNTALALDRNYLNPQINLGNLLFLKQDYEGALRVYHSAEEKLQAGGLEGSSLFPSVLVNISRAYYELENYEKATGYYERAVARDSSLAEQYSYLSKKEKGEKAASAAGSRKVLFAGGEE
jgi:hypothetical protein